MDQRGIGNDGPGQRSIAGVEALKPTGPCEYRERDRGKENGDAPGSQDGIRAEDFAEVHREDGPGQDREERHEPRLTRRQHRECQPNRKPPSAQGSSVDSERERAGGEENRKRPRGKAVAAARSEGGEPPGVGEKPGEPRVVPEPAGPDVRR